MNHIRFMTTRETVCMAPEKLGTEFMVVDFDSSTSCRVCTQLIEAHNKREYERQQFERLAIARDAQGKFEKNVGYGIAYISNDKPKSNFEARAFAIGAMIASIFWIVFYALLEAL